MFRGCLLILAVLVSSLGAWPTAHGTVLDHPALGSPGLHGLGHSDALHVAAGAKARTRKHKSPCSPAKTRKQLAVRRESDILRRLLYPPTQTVHMIFDRSLSLSKGLVLNESFSCTIFQAAGARGRVTLYNDGWSAPVISVVGGGNMLFIGISIRNSVTRGAPSCNWEGFKWGAEGHATCPALYIIESYGVQYTKAAVWGRIDIFRSAYIKVDSVKATMAKDSYSPSVSPTSFNVRGVIRIGECSTGPSFRKSGIVISNNEVYGSWELITLYRGAIGVTVRNNYFHDYVFAAIRAGADVGYVMDAALATISYNYIYSTPYKTLTGDSAGIYFCTHWFNPGIYLTCNYVIGGDHCYYFDYVSSGIEVFGGVCAYNFDGLKFNTGKFNLVRHVIMLGLTQSMSYISCMYSNNDVNCGKYPGEFWERHRAVYYDSPQINGPYPWMKTICHPAGKSKVNGKSCNLPGGKNWSPRHTGHCSGVPYSNDIAMVYVDYKEANAPDSFCFAVPSWENLNNQDYVSMSWKEAAFIGKGDFGLQRSSKILKQNSAFTSCPRKLVGPRRVSVTSYYNDWNIPKPGILNLIINNDFSNINID